MGSIAGPNAVDGGMDYTIGGVAPDDVADMASIRVYGAYRGPEAAIEGEWSLPVELEPAEQRVILVGPHPGGRLLCERIRGVGHEYCRLLPGRGQELVRGVGHR